MLLDVPDAQDLPHVNELLGQAHGTLVLWQHFDKLSAGETSTQDTLGERMDLARDHLSLVFHRFLGARQHQLSIAFNLNPLRALDPFLISHKATQALPEEEFTVEGERVKVAPYILPHLSKLSASDLQVAGGEDGLRRNQGFYVYRNQRLRGQRRHRCRRRASGRSAICDVRPWARPRRRVATLVAVGAAGATWANLARLWWLSLPSSFHHGQTGAGGLTGKWPSSRGLGPGWAPTRPGQLILPGWGSGAPTYLLRDRPPGQLRFLLAGLVI